MRTLALGELVVPAQVQRAGGAQFPVLSMTMRTGLVEQAERFKKRIASVDTSEYKVVRHGQLVVGFPINEGVLDFQTQFDAAVVSPAYGIWDLRDESLVDRDYLKRFLRSPRAIAYYLGKMKGSTARRRSLPTAEFNAMPVPLPSLSEQRRIAAILDHADALCAKRRQVLGCLDELTRSIFHDMFGRGTWSRQALGDVAKTSSGGTPDRSIPENYGGGIPWVKSGELRAGVIAETEETLTELGLRSSSAKLLAPGTVLIAMYGATAGVVGQLGVEAATNQAVCAVTPGSSVTDSYLIAFLRSQSRELLDRRSGGAQPNLNQGTIRSLQIPLPPLEVQQRFADRVRCVARQRDLIAHAVEIDDGLFASLQSRAFRGEL